MHRWLDRVKQLSDKLSDIPWWNLKGLDHKRTAQAFIFIYILVDENNDLPSLKQHSEWVGMDYPLQKFSLDHSIPIVTMDKVQFRKHAYNA